MPTYAFVKLKSGHETTVSLRDVAPCPHPIKESASDVQKGSDLSQQGKESLDVSGSGDSGYNISNNENDSNTDVVPFEEIVQDHVPADNPLDLDTHSSEGLTEKPVLRRSTRTSKPRSLFADSKYSKI